MIRLTEEEQNAVALDQLSRIAAERTEPRKAGWWHVNEFSLEPIRTKTRYHVLVRPLENGRLRLVLAASRRIGEAKGVATWLVGEEGWRIACCFDFYGCGGWVTQWGPDAERGETWACQRSPGPPVWPWATFANATAATDTPWEWICRAARGVEEKALTRFFAAAARFPRAELIARAGLSPNWFAPGILEKLEKDADLARFVAQNAAEIARDNLRPLDVVGPFRRGRSIDWMRRETGIRRAWDACPTHGVDYREAERYLEAQKRRARERMERGGVGCGAVAWIEPTRLDYSYYLGNCVRLGLDVRSRSVAFPKSLSAASGRVRAELVRRQRAERRRQEAEAAALRERMRRDRKLFGETLERIAASVRRIVSGLRLPSGWSVVVPDNHEAFHDEGERMGNCIGSGFYDRAMAEGRCVCVFIVGPRESRADCEIAFGKLLRVSQLYGRHNEPPSDQARRIARMLVAALEKKRKEAA